MPPGLLPLRHQGGIESERTCTQQVDTSLGTCIILHKTQMPFSSKYFVQSLCLFVLHPLLNIFTYSNQFVRLKMTLLNCVQIIRNFIVAPNFTECQSAKDLSSEIWCCACYTMPVTFMYAPSIQRCAQSIESYAHSLTVSKIVCSQ